jgi:transcriptional regulator with XRE-family HTH domain
LQKQLAGKNWRVKDLAQHSHKSDAAVSRILNGQRKADTETLVAFATALNISPVVIFRRAGRLPEGDEEHVQFEDWEYILRQLSPDDQDEMRQLALLKIERHKKDLPVKSLKTKKA